MLSESLLNRFDVFTSTATVAAHASAKGEGFRQRDVKFFVELFSNWAESSFPTEPLIAQNTQVLRYLETLVKEGYARKLSRKTHPLYRLTRGGLIELLARNVRHLAHSGPGQFFFLYYFTQNYRTKIEALVEIEGAHFPPALRKELDSLLDADALLRSEMSRVKKELRRLDLRIEDGYRASDLVKKRAREGKPFPDIVAEIEKLYPYELNSMKPLTELIDGIPADMQQWELESGSRFRVEQIWEPSKHLLAKYEEELKKLSKK